MGVLFAVALVAAPLAHGEEIRHWTVQEVQTLVVEHSPELKIARATADVDNARADHESVLARPELSVELGQAESGGVAGLTQEWSVRQVLPFPTKIFARSRSVAARQASNKVEFENRRLEVQHQAVLNAVRLGNLTEIGLHSGERQARFRLIQQYLKSHPQASPSQQVDAALVENQIRILEKGILELEQSRAGLALDLAGAMGVESPVQVVVPWIDAPVVPERKNTVVRVLAQSRVIRTLEARVEDYDRRADLAAQDWIPDLVLGGLYRLERLAPTNQFVAASIGISLPLWNRGQHLERAVRAEGDVQRASLAWERGQLERRALKAVAAVELSAEIIRRFPLALVREADRKFQTAEQEFRRGRITGTALLQTDAQIHETLDSIFESQWKYLRAWSELKLLLGEKLEWPVAAGGI